MLHIKYLKYSIFNLSIFQRDTIYQKDSCLSGKVQFKKTNKGLGHHHSKAVEPMLAKDKTGTDILSSLIRLWKIPAFGNVCPCGYLLVFIFVLLVFMDNHF